MNDVTTNSIIDKSISIVDEIFGHHKYPQELSNILYLVTIGMFMTYGDKYFNDIYDSLSSIKFIIKPYKSFGSSNFADFYVNPINNNYIIKCMKQNSFSNNIDFQYKVLFNKIDDSFLKTLEFLTCSLNYLLFHRNDKATIKNSFKALLDNFLYNDCFGINALDQLDIIDKTILLLQSETIIKNILKIKLFKTKNHKIKVILRKIKISDWKSYKIDGDNILVSLIRPLYNDKEIKNIINSKNGKALLRNKFNKILGKNAFHNFCLSMNDLNLIVEKINQASQFSYYDLSLNYINLRNNYVNKIISEKF